MQTTKLSHAVMMAVAFTVVTSAGIAGTVDDADAQPYGKNITIYDGEGVRYEDNEAEVGMIQNQSWDLEGAFQKGSILTMIGGYNFKAGNSGFTSGDLFISTTGNYGTPIGDFGSNAMVNNSFGYEYVLDINWSTLAFDVYRLDSTDITKTAYYVQNQTGTATSNPWQYVSGGEKVGSGFGSGGGLVTDSELNGWGSDNKHYAVSFDLIAVFDDANLHGGNFYSHFTMGCGNDNLIGQGAIPAPEPSTLLLLGAGLLGLGFARRRSSKND
jgi:hypothetical protein